MALRGIHFFTQSKAFPDCGVWHLVNKFTLCDLFAAFRYLPPLTYGLKK